MNKVIGIPSDGPELVDPISEHFGHCNYFVGVEIDQETIIFSYFYKENYNLLTKLPAPVVDTQTLNFLKNFKKILKKNLFF